MKDVEAEHILDLALGPVERSARVDEVKIRGLYRLLRAAEWAAAHQDTRAAELREKISASLERLGEPDPREVWAQYVERQ